ncbi:MAG: GNAT family N-acetyltransferase, partial [Candidatus Polarisedimenticolia bacterium]
MHQPLIAAATAGRPAPAGPPPLRTEVVTDAAGLEGLAAEWERLAVAAGLEHPFLTHAWARTWWECFGAGRRPHVLVVREGQETVALAPLMACTRRICGVPARAIASMHNEHTPRFDLLVARRADEAYAAIWDRLLAARADWDLLEIAPVPAASPTLTALLALATRDGCRTGTWQGAPSPYVPLGGGWDALLRDLSHNRRAQMRKRLRRLERLGPVDLEVITVGPVVDEALEEGLRMEADGWKGRAGTAILCRGEVARFYRKLAL